MMSLITTMVNPYSQTSDSLSLAPTSIGKGQRHRQPSIRLNDYITNTVHNFDNLIIARDGDVSNLGRVQLNLNPDPNFFIGPKSRSKSIGF